MDIEPDESYDAAKDKRLREFICDDIIRRATKRGWVTRKQHNLLMFAGRTLPPHTRVVLGPPKRRNRA